MKIVIPGGTGQVGTLLARAFVADGHEVVVLSRNPVKAPWQVVYWDGATLTESELVLKSRRVFRTRLLQSGFRSRFPTWAEAAADLCRRRRELPPRGRSEAPGMI